MPGLGGTSHASLNFLCPPECKPLAGLVGLGWMHEGLSQRLLMSDTRWSPTVLISTQCNSALPLLVQYITVQYINNPNICELNFCHSAYLIGNVYVLWASRCSLCQPVVPTHVQYRLLERHTSATTNHNGLPVTWPRWRTVRLMGLTRVLLRVACEFMPRVALTRHWPTYQSYVHEPVHRHCLRIVWALCSN